MWTFSKLHICVALASIAATAGAQTSRLDSVQTLGDVSVVGVKPHYNREVDV